MQPVYHPTSAPANGREGDPNAPDFNRGHSGLDFGNYFL